MDDDRTLEEASIDGVGDGVDTELVENSDGVEELEVDATAELVEKIDDTTGLDDVTTELVEKSEGAAELDEITSDDDENRLEAVDDTDEEDTVLEDCWSDDVTDVADGLEATMGSCVEVTLDEASLDAEATLDDKTVLVASVSTLLRAGLGVLVGEAVD